MDEKSTEEIRDKLARERASVRARIRLAASLPRGIIGRSGAAPREPIVMLVLDYDPDEDILFCQLGESGDAMTEEVAESLYLRVDPTTCQPLGFEVLDYQEANKDTRRLIEGVFPEAKAAVSQGEKVILKMPRDAAEKRLRRLVPEDWPSIFTDKEALLG